jgi:GT2 family glycosyltransferase
MEPFVSIVVPTFDRQASLARLLGSLEQQRYRADCFEVLVVDDGSTDGTIEWLGSLQPAWRLRVLAQAHSGPALARNLGVEQADGSLILFLDDDVVAQPELLAEHVATQARSPDAVVVGPMSPPNDWPRSVWVRWEEAKLQRQYAAMLAGQYPCTPRQFYTGNASLSRARFREAGGFDARFKRAEDVELAYRLSRRGARFIFNPRAEVLHFASRSFEAWCRTPYQYGQYDVVMERDKGHRTLQIATREFHRRHGLNRRLTRLCVGRRSVLDVAVFYLRQVVHLADRLGSERAASAALSGIFNLLYWQGVCDELGGAQQLWHSLAASAPVSA